jgi:hypothetical protein
MKRMAILIASPTVNIFEYDPRNLPGANNSIKYWKSQLQTPKLGAWEDETEIQEASSWNLDTLLSFIRTLNGYYIFVVYCGHGARFPKKGCAKPISDDNFEDYILLKNGSEKARLEEILETIDGVTDKATVMIDACRMHNLDVQDYEKNQASLPMQLNESQQSLSGFLRKKWMQMLDKCDAVGVVLIQSCSPREEAHLFKYENDITIFTYVIFEYVKNVSYSVCVKNVLENLCSKVNFWSNLNHGLAQNPTCNIDDIDTINYPFAVNMGEEIASYYAEEK